jgi:hypothetical protein
MVPRDIQGLELANSLIEGTLTHNNFVEWKKAHMGKNYREETAKKWFSSTGLTFASVMRKKLSRGKLCNLIQRETTGEP